MAGVSFCKFLIYLVMLLFNFVVVLRAVILGWLLDWLVD